MDYPQSSLWTVFLQSQSKLSEVISDSGKLYNQNYLLGMWENTFLYWPFRRSNLSPNKVSLFWWYSSTKIIFLHGCHVDKSLLQCERNCSKQRKSRFLSELHFTPIFSITRGVRSAGSFITVGHLSLPASGLLWFWHISRLGLFSVPFDRGVTADVEEQHIFICCLSMSAEGTACRERHWRTLLM